jgi:hypothetical protein
MSDAHAAPQAAQASLADAQPGAQADTAPQSSSFDLLRARLGDHGKALLDKAGALNTARLAEFGRQEMVLRARTRARTDNNCVARDLVPVGDVLLFGYNVFIGLRQETKVSDVFGLYRLRREGDQAELDPVPLGQSFLDDPRFLLEFRVSCWRPSRLASALPTCACSAGH